ncbi:MAG: hypothetical protein LAP85_01710 [Acidobacteriia bacterium]|nr:hypothetical protein [Terriglobia bacterium]
MKEFLRKHGDRIHSTLSCFDRMLFRGYLPLMSGWAMAQFLDLLKLDGSSLKRFLLQNSERVKDHAVAMARKYNRRFEYLRSHIRKEERARELAERDGIEEGLVCVFSIVESCRTFSLRFSAGSRFVRSASRKCLHFYYYFMDRDFGLIHVRIQSWFPMQIQVYVNGHEWLARKLDAHDVAYSKLDNVLVSVSDITRAQKFADRFQSLDWPRILNRYARRVNPQMRDLLHSFQYYWVTAQSEYSTDIQFKSRRDLCELYPQLLCHSTLCFGAKEVMNFLGRKLNGNFQGEIVSDLSTLACRRIGGSRIKHRVKENWLKMYDKAGLVLRVETVINNPEEFRVRKRVTRKGKTRMEWVDMRKGVAWLFRYREVSLKANSRYLDALAVVDDPTDAKRDLDRITTRKKDAAGRGCSAFNPLAHSDAELFRAVMDGEHCVRGFTNRDIRTKLQLTQHLRACGQDRKKASSKVSRIFRRFHAHGLIAKFPRSRRWRVTLYGRRVMGTALYLRERDFARAHAKIAA